MKRWLPYVAAGVLGVAIAVAASLPRGRGDAAGGKERVRAEAAEAAEAPAGQEEAGEARPSRPPNKAQLEHAAKLARPFNKHFDRVSAFWNRAAQLVGPDDPALGKECGAMVRLLREQSTLVDEQLDLPTVIGKELALVAKLRAVPGASDELTGVLDYIEESSRAVLDGKDPTTVLKPSQKAGK